MSLPLDPFLPHLPGWLLVLFRLGGIFVFAPVLASKATGAADLPGAPAVQLFEPDHPAQLAEVMIQAKNNQGRDVSREARKIAEGCAWKNYRKRVSEAVVPFL